MERATLPDIDALMGRIHAEVARRRGLPPPFPPPRRAAVWKPPAGWAARTAFTAEEILGLPDEHFVAGAFVAVLGCMPDPPAARHHLDLLRSGEVSKPDMLIGLMATPAARARGATISGLERRRRALALRRLPLIGRFISAALLLRGLPALARDVRRATATCEQLALRNARMAEEIARLREQVSWTGDMPADEKPDKRRG